MWALTQVTSPRWALQWALLSWITRLSRQTVVETTLTTGAMIQLGARRETLLRWYGEYFRIFLKNISFRNGRSASANSRPGIHIETSLKKLYHQCLTPYYLYRSSGWFESSTPVTFSAQWWVIITVQIVYEPSHHHAPQSGHLCRCSSLKPPYAKRRLSDDAISQISKQFSKFWMVP